MSRSLRFNRETVLARLEEIHRADPVADLAKELLDDGVTEDELHGMLQGDLESVLGCELYNKHRDLGRRGWTFNRFGVRVTR